MSMSAVHKLPSFPSTAPAGQLRPNTPQNSPHSDACSHTHTHTHTHTTKRTHTHTLLRLDREKVNNKCKFYQLVVDLFSVQSEQCVCVCGSKTLPISVF